MSELNTWPCPGKPEDLKGQPIGMYHCEYCGEMQVAGLSHLPPQFPSQWQEPFPKVDGPTLPSMPVLLGLLEQSTLRRDSELTRAHLALMLDHDPATQRPVWDSLQAARDEPHAAFILGHLNIDKDDNDNWIVSLKGEF